MGADSLTENTPNAPEFICSICLSKYKSSGFHWNNFGFYISITNISNNSDQKFRWSGPKYSIHFSWQRIWFPGLTSNSSKLSLNQHFLPFFSNYVVTAQPLVNSRERFVFFGQFLGHPAAVLWYIWLAGHRIWSEFPKIVQK